MWVHACFLCHDTATNFHRDNLGQKEPLFNKIILASPFTSVFYFLSYCPDPPFFWGFYQLDSFLTLFFFAQNLFWSRPCFCDCQKMSGVSSLQKKWGKGRILDRNVAHACRTSQSVFVHSVGKVQQGSSTWSRSGQWEAGQLHKHHKGFRLLWTVFT